MNAEIFKPTFRTDVSVSVGGRLTAVAPKQSLTETSAAELQEILAGEGKPSKIIQGHPMGLAGGAAVEDAAGNPVTVPYLQFLDGPDGNPGTKVNAGLIADYWMHQTWNIALRYALQEVEGEAKNQGFSS